MRSKRNDRFADLPYAWRRSALDRIRKRAWNQDEPCVLVPKARGARLRWALIIAVSLLVETIPLWLRGYALRRNVVARCRDGHLFTTIWIPGASLKAVRFGPWRFQRCPVGRHWSIVTPVRRTGLSEDEQRLASENKDIRIP